MAKMADMPRLTQMGMFSSSMMKKEPNRIRLIILLKTGYDKVLTQMANGKLTSSLGWHEWVFTIFLPIGSVFLILHTIEFFIDTMRGESDCVKIEE